MNEQSAPPIDNYHRMQRHSDGPSGPWWFSCSICGFEGRPHYSRARFGVAWDRHVRSRTRSSS